MIRYDAYPWDELVPGAYVYDAEGVPWKLIEEHPQRKGVFRAVSVEQKTAVLTDPGKPVRAMVPDEEEALAYLHRILGARAAEDQIYVDHLPTSTSASAKAKIRAHLKTLHNEYVEPSMKVTDMLEVHRAAHASAQYGIPHTHRSRQ